MEINKDIADIRAAEEILHISMMKPSTPLREMLSESASSARSVSPTNSTKS